jgi:hypothetical protein
MFVRWSEKHLGQRLTSFKRENTFSIRICYEMLEIVGDWITPEILEENFSVRLWSGPFCGPRQAFASSCESKACNAFSFVWWCKGLPMSLRHKTDRSRVEHWSSLLRFLRLFDLLRFPTFQNKFWLRRCFGVWNLPAAVQDASRSTWQTGSKKHL